MKSGGALIPEIVVLFGTTVFAQDDHNIEATVDYS